jgi:pyruvate-ferredoxin/flavodoxin oxidoreductase
MTKGMDQMKAAVTSGMWPLYRFNPGLEAEGKNPLVLDSKEPSTDVADYIYNEVRFRSLLAADPDRADMLLNELRTRVDRQYKEYKYLADRSF